MNARCAVVGVGQTHHAASRRDVTLGGLVREAAERALLDADLGWNEIDAVVLGKGPDIMEGLMSPELYLADALGAVGKPILRAYTSGNAGGVAATMGVSLISAGIHARVLVVAFEKQSESSAAGSTLQHLPFEARWQGGTGSLFGAICREYIHRSGAPAHIGDVAALKDRQNAVRNPFAQVRRGTSPWRQSRPRGCCGIRSDSCIHHPPPTVRVPSSCPTSGRQPDTAVRHGFTGAR